jgi:hypothetical protein
MKPSKKKQVPDVLVIKELTAWCGTPTVDEGKIKPPKQEKIGDTPKIVEKNLVAWCGTPQMDEDHPLSQTEELKTGSAPSEGDGPRDAEGSRAKADESKKPKP